MLDLRIDPEALRPLVQAIVVEAIQHLERDRAVIANGKLAFSEPEAAALLSLESHQLRDERRRGRIQASVGPGRKILYTQRDLLDYLATRRWSERDGR